MRALTHALLLYPTPCPAPIPTADPHLTAVFDEISGSDQGSPPGASPPLSLWGMPMSKYRRGCQPQPSPPPPVAQVNVYGQLRHGHARCTECSARQLPPDKDERTGCDRHETFHLPALRDRIVVSPCVVSAFFFLLVFLLLRAAVLFEMLALRCFEKLLYADTYWHRDDPCTGSWGQSPPRFRSLKMFVNVFAVSEDGGPIGPPPPPPPPHRCRCCPRVPTPVSAADKRMVGIVKQMVAIVSLRPSQSLDTQCTLHLPAAVVPRTHTLEHGPWETLGRSYRSTMTLDAEVIGLELH